MLLLLRRGGPRRTTINRPSRRRSSTTPVPPVPPVPTSTRVSVPYKRVRQHVNPFAGELRRLRPTPAQLHWPSRLASPGGPFHVDLGCAAGNYLFACARRAPGVNFVGLEIRRQLVDVADYRQRVRDRVPNLAFLHCNLLVPGALDAVLESMGSGNVRSVSVFHPDPNFKRRRKKRTVLTPALAETLAKRLPAGAHVYLQSDVEPLFLEMAKVLQANPGFAPLADADVGRGPDFCSRRDNAMGVRTDREVSVLKQEGLEVWRKNFVKV